MRVAPAFVSLVAAFVALLAAVAPSRAAQQDALPVAGWLERARISPGEVVMEAKLDSGALTSSLHATNIEKFERDGKGWVAFDVAGDDDGRRVRIERPIVRVAQVKSALGTDESRLTVTLGICIGSVYRVTEVNLADRNNVTKPLLIGRRFLRGRLLVDLKRRYLLEPACTKKAVP
jgi:hypothetical protein